MSFTTQCNQIFNQAIRDYHIKNDVDTPINNPYDRESIENRLYLKCWIDTVQWRGQSHSMECKRSGESYIGSTCEVPS